MAATVRIPTSKAPSLTYRPHLDGLRALAVVMVFVFHAARPALPSGFIGVDVFFVLSGYLITSVLLSQYEDRGGVLLREFYARRIRRLTPAVILVVVAVAIREAVWGSILEAGLRIREIFATLFYVANWNLIDLSDDYFAQGANVFPLRHAWSLAVEEQFYLVWPVLLVGLLAWRRGRRRVVLGVTLTLTLASVIVMALLYEPGSINRIYYGTDTRIHQPLLGAALAVIFYRRPWRRVKPLLSAFLGWAGLVVLGLIALLQPGINEFYFRGGSVIIGLATVAHLIGVESQPESRTAGLLGLEPLRYLGTISYGFYLWHWPIIVWLRAPEGATFLDRRLINLLQFALTLAIAAASHALVEDPIRARRAFKKLQRPTAVIAAGFAALALAAVASWALVSGNNHDIADAVVADRSYEPCPDNPRPCVKVQSDNPEAPVIALVGDSTAQSYDPALKLLAEQYDLTYVQAAVGGCPIGHRLLATGIDGQLHKPSNLMCWEELPGIYDELLDRWDPALIIATSWNETNDHITNGEVIESGTDRHLAEVASSLREAVGTLTSEGARLVFIDILPPGPSVTCLEKASPSASTCERPRVRPEAQQPYNELFSHLAAAMPSVSQISLTSEVCLEQVCPLKRDGIVMRYDGGHLTGTASQRLAGPLSSALVDEGIDLSGLDDLEASKQVSH